MATVSLRTLRKSYGDTEVVHGVDLEIHDEEFVVLVGPSGCGKSTILRMLAGLEDITAGQIAIDGVVVNDKDPKDRDIAMVFQDYALYPHMSVFENMAFSLRYRRVDKAEIRRRVEEAARVLEIGALLDRKPRQLSGGQRQRVAMGRAIVRKPKVFLFDEPLSNLDAKLRVQMRTEIKKLRERVRTTTVFVTHDQVEAMTLADRIVVLNNGVVLQVGAPEEIYERPETTFVAGFIGVPPMNLLPGHLERHDGRPVAVLPGGATLPLNAAQVDGDPGRKVFVGLRPEHLEWAPQGGTDNMLSGPASVVEPLGSDTLVAFDLGGHDVQARLPPRSVRSAGTPVQVRVASENIHLFDHATERRLGP
jgi:ABC-type sugar transport system ATPase subunit